MRILGRSNGIEKFSLCYLLIVAISGASDTFLFTFFNLDGNVVEDEEEAANNLS